MVVGIGNVGWYGNANANDMRADIVLEGNAWVWFHWLNLLLFLCL